MPDMYSRVQFQLYPRAQAPKGESPWKPPLIEPGYSIHYQAIGAGPRVVWAHPGARLQRDASAGRRHRRAARHFEVVTYDRRGRGRNEPTDNPSVGDEVEDLVALVSEVGGAAIVLGFGRRRGGASRCPPPGHPRSGPARAGRRGQARRERVAGASRRCTGAGRPTSSGLAFYDALGVPEEVVQEQMSSSAWPHVVSSAGTLLTDIDLAVVDDDAIAAIGLPTHIIVSAGSPDEIARWPTNSRDD